MPKAEGPEEDRDEVLYPAMDRRKTASSHRKMGRCCVVEDADQKVDREDKPNLTEKKPYISSDSPICGPARGGAHLCSPPVWALEVVRMSDRFCGQYPGRGNLRAQRREAAKLVADARGARGNLRTQDVVLVPRFEHHSNIAALRHEPGIVSRDTPVR